MKFQGNTNLNHVGSYFEIIHKQKLNKLNFDVKLFVIILKFWECSNFKKCKVCNEIWS